MTAEKLFFGRNLTLQYKMGDVMVDALRGLNFEIDAGRFTCLAGPSGSGKSTLLNVLGLVEPLQSGELLYKDRSYSQLKEEEMNRIRRFDFGFVFQSFHLIDVLTAEENVEYFLARQGVSVVEREKRARSALAWVGLEDQRKKRPAQMSGGQRQRVAVARALAKSPRVILADEPTANLDSRTGTELLELLNRLCNEGVCSVVMASHDAKAIQMASRVIHLHDGQIAEGS